MTSARVVVALLLFLVSGCKAVEEVWNETFNSGTVSGVSKCIELSANELLSKETVKESCVAKFEQELPSSVFYDLTGKGGPDSYMGRKVFDGTIENKTPDYVVTEFVVKVELSEKPDSEKKTFRAVIRGWFEPNAQLQPFRSLEVLGAPENWGTSSLCAEDEDRKCWGWWISSARGLKL